MTAKKKQSTEVAVVEKNGVPAAAGAPSYLANYTGATGMEDMQSDEITLPRIKIGQDMSKEVQNGDIERGDLFLNLSSEVLAEAGKPLVLVPLWRGVEVILWRPRKDNGGGILARARPVRVDGVLRYKWDKPNTSFDVKVDGKIAVTWKTKTYTDEDGLTEWGSEIPGDKNSKKAATEHFNYVVALPEHGNMIAGLSLENTRAARAKNFNAMLKMRADLPIWSRVFTITSEDDNRGSDKFKNVTFKPAGFVSEQDFPRYDTVAKSFIGRTININDAQDEDEAEGGKL